MKSRTTSKGARLNTYGTISFNPLDNLIGTIGTSLLESLVYHMASLGESNELHVGGIENNGQPRVIADRTQGMILLCQRLRDSCAWAEHLRDICPKITRPV